MVARSQPPVPGRFHVLRALVGAGGPPRDLAIETLVARVSRGNRRGGAASERHAEGQTTAHYLAERLERFPVRLTQLAHGLPVGGELDFLDEGTLSQALRARRPVA